MRVFTTMMLDSLRMLRARVLFWVTLGLSGLVAVLFLSVGFNESGVTLLFGALDFENELLSEGSVFVEVFYLGVVFSLIVVGGWLSWPAVGLGLISCASIFPDFIAEGSIGISLSKPVGRLRLFCYKLVGSLLFVTLQVVIFCVIVFFAIRWRLGIWNPSVFWAVPIVLLVFSYLNAVVVFMAVYTRSVVVAIFAALLVWGVSSIGQKFEDFLYMQAQRETSRSEEKTTFRDWHRGVESVMWVLPKTGETTRLLDRLIVVGGKRGISAADVMAVFLGQRPGDGAAIDAAVQRHSLWYVIGSSLGFELLLLGLAARRFCRQDF
jgi:hypothetical protein